ncbi:MAG: DUF4154 domain-containing protein [Chlorobi bacterium]|nr:DUF4154 domain-containing protein [Chlorobiota bacterium]
MKNKALFKLITSFILLINTVFSFSQVGFTNKDRAEYILDIMKYVTWNSENKISNYKILLLDNDSLLFRQIDSLILERKVIHNKPIKVSLINKIIEIDDCQVLFTKKESGFDITNIVDRISGKNTLLITENFAFHRSMINFIVVNNEKRFEVNEHMLANNNLTVKPLFLALAVNNRRDWESLFYKSDSMLINEEKIVKKKTTKILAQKQTIENQFNRIISQKNKIALQDNKIKVQQEKLNNLSSEIFQKQGILNKQQKNIKEKEAEIDSFRIMIEKQQDLQNNLQADINKKQKLIINQNKKMITILSEIKKQTLIIYLFAAFILLLVAFVIFIYRSYKIKKRVNKKLAEQNTAILEQNEEILQQKEEILAQRDEIEAQRDKILIQNVEIKDSILYARRIQNAILPGESFINTILSEYFIFYLPRDIVSGDFYWIIKKKNKIIIAVADCTGHGVPGAFMSMLGVSFLNEIIGKNDYSASQILDALRAKVKITLSQTGKKDEAKDGMDMVICILDEQEKILQYAGANNPIYLVRNGELIKYKPDKMPIGIFIKDDIPFTNQLIELQKGDCFYMFSDGFVDQFGGEKGRKFNSKKFKELLCSIYYKNMNEQEQDIKNTFLNWITNKNQPDGKYQQIDDVLVVGVKIE